MSPECQVVFERCQEYLDEALKQFDQSAMNGIPAPLRPMVSSRIAEVRILYGNGLRDAYLTAVWETLMGRAMPWSNEATNWEAEIQAALDNRF